ncbi:MAG TPA: glycosyltransferase family 39 protein, partial [Candidatus Binatia bacterium]|nr:glycosyltransferase family 39 protein [Candidatus Binatia bacterium]
DRWLDMEIARAVAAGDLLGGAAAPYDSAPAYGLVLGIAYRALGLESIGPLVIQAFLGAAVSLLLYGAGRRLASEPAGLAAAALAAVYAPAIFYEGLTVKFAVVPFTVAVLLYALAVTTANRSARAAAVTAGIATAILVAVRPNAVVVLPVALGWIAWQRRDARAVATILLFAAGLVAVAAPLALRRTFAAERGDAASLWGIHFYVGSQLDGDGGYVPVPGISDDVVGHVEDARALAEANSGRALTPAEVSRYWFERGLAEIAREPGRYVRLLGRKLRRVAAEGEEGDFGDDYGSYAALSPVLRAGIGFGTIAPLAVLGLAVAVKGRPGLAWTATIAAAYALSLLPFFVTGRYRLPIIPPLLLLAGAGTVWLARAWRSERSAAAVASLVLLGGAAILGASGAVLARLTTIVVVTVIAAVCRVPEGQPVRE